jgi:tetratricopeptide (TPR) repeat protein
VPETPDFKPADGTAPLPPKRGAGDSDGSRSSSSSGGGDLPDPDAKPGLKDAGTRGSTRAERRRLRPMAEKMQSNDERVDEDLQVADFYSKRGNKMGAYLRAKDAVKTEPDEADTHLALAQAADQMGKKDEAVTEYRAYLKLEPDGDGVKTAEQALTRLNP